MRYYARIKYFKYYSLGYIASSVQESGRPVKNIYVGDFVCDSDGLMQYSSIKVVITYNKILELCKIKRWDI